MERSKGWEYYFRLVLNVLVPLSGWLLLCFLGPKILKFFMPFVIGWVLAAIANPPVRFLERHLKLVRRHSSILIVVAVLAAVIGLIYLICSRAAMGLSLLVDALPALYEAAMEDIRESAGRASFLLALLPPELRDSWSEIGSSLGKALGLLAQKAAPPTVEAAGNVAKSIPGMLVYSVVIILSSYFFIVDRDRIMALGGRLMPEWGRRYCGYLKGEVRRLIGGYFLAQFKIMAVVWALLTVGFLVLGVGYSPLVAFLIAFLDFLPVFGTGTALIPWALIRVLGGEYAFAAGLALLYVLTQVVRQLVQPKLVGDTMGLNPLLTLVLLFLGFKLSGLAGMILAVPIGLFFKSLYEYGAFDGMLKSLMTLIREINAFRREG